MPFSSLVGSMIKNMQDAREKKHLKEYEKIIIGH